MKYSGGESRNVHPNSKPENVKMLIQHLLGKTLTGEFSQNGFAHAHRHTHTALEWPNTSACIISAVELLYGTPLDEVSCAPLWYAGVESACICFALSISHLATAWRGLARPRRASLLAPTPGAHHTPCCLPDSCGALPIIWLERPVLFDECKSVMLAPSHLEPGWVRPGKEALGGDQKALGGGQRARLGRWRRGGRPWCRDVRCVIGRGGEGN